MNIQPITPNFTGNIVYRVSREFGNNAKNSFLLNDMLEVVRNQKLPAIFHNNMVDVTLDSKYQQKEITAFKETLNKAGIKFKLLV